jgi:hypothetical protein
MRIAVLAIGLAAAAAGCTPDYGEESEAPVLIRVSNIVAEGGGGAAGSSGIGSVLNSDVAVEGSIFNDNATLTVENIAKNQNPNTQFARLNDVILERYEVRYTRSDGRDQEGVDVPFRIAGPLAVMVPLAGDAQVPITIVRHQAKAESPLRNLMNGGGAQVLTTVARITIHGRTVSGRAVMTETALQITFADFADQ